MKGTHKVRVSAKRLRYDFELRRNITVIRGDSATGKTTLVDMVQEYVNNPSGSSVELVCDRKCYVLSGPLWKQQLSGMRDSIVFIDEGNEFIKTDDFSREIQRTDNYYVIVSRESLPALPYSVEEIYGIRTSGKYGVLKQTYHEFYHIYGTNVLRTDVRPELILTEDSNSGFDFFQAVSEENELKCVSAKGKSNIFHYLNVQNDGWVLAVADGAAFGSEIDRVLRLAKEKKNVAVYLPESFEWLILSSGIFNREELKNILADPAIHIESSKFFSWEQYFTNLLIHYTKDTRLAYSKKKLNMSYLDERIKKKIVETMEKIDFAWKRKAAR